MLNTVDIELIGSCNYSCAMCPQGNPGRNSDFLKALPQSLFENIIDQTVELGARNVRLHGSGEPTLCKYLSEAVAYCTHQGLKTEITTNGARLNRYLIEQLVQAGLDDITVSVIGATEQDYLLWMNSHDYHTVKSNIKLYNSISTKPANMYHLITPKSTAQHYKTNWLEQIGGTCEIWQMHNWSGAYDNLIYPRSGQKRTCGRPFDPVLTVRAGGHGEHKGAVVPCCMTLGNDKDAVIGHLDTHSVKTIWNNKTYNSLRVAHKTENWDSISYCKNCDQLYQSQDTLIYTNRKDIEYGKPKYLD